jgi:nicotinamidase-related amidase
MTLTALDPKSALIIIDLQNGIVAFPTVHPAAEIVQRAASLADAFRRKALPVVLVNVNAVPPGRTEQGRNLGELPDGWTDFVAELNRQPEDHVVTKRSQGAFMHTGLTEFLRGAGVTQVVVTGIATGSGVESTARQAYELGFNVTLATDAMTDLDLDTHNHSVTKVFPRLGETGTTAEIIDLLKQTLS